MKKNRIIKSINKTIRRYQKMIDNDDYEEVGNTNICAFCIEFKEKEGRYGCRKCPNKTGEDYSTLPCCGGKVIPVKYLRSITTNQKERTEFRIYTLEIWSSWLDVLWGSKISVKDARQLQVGAIAYCKQNPE